LKAARVARLATLDAAGRPHIVPVCFAYDGKVFYTAIDRKPKRVPAERLARVRNITATHKVALIADEYSEDWTRLWYVLVTGRAGLVRDRQERSRAIRMLRKKYPQYAGGMLEDDALVIRIVPRKIKAWGAL
jgi:PPOX class probable F420-dependent enzyme